MTNTTNLQSTPMMRALAAAIRANVPTLLWGQPGVTKTASIEAHAAEWGFHTEVVVGGCREAVDFMGLPVEADGEVRYSKLAWFRRLEGAERGLLVLDEFTSIAPATMRAMVRIVQERWVGDHQLPDSTSIVAIAMVWNILFSPEYGPINQILRFIGIADPPGWLTSPAWALPAVALISMWRDAGYYMILFLAGLQTIPRELYEAARMDGANGWQRFWNVTLPGLRPVIVAITTLDFIHAFNSFALVYVLTNGANGTELPMLFAYNTAFRYGDFGLASAMGNVIVVVIAVFLFFYLRSQAKARLES